MARCRRGFSLIELVIVVVIIGIVAAIAIPRMSRAGTSSRTSALAANVNTLQRAIDRYTAEVGRAPVRNADNTVNPSWKVMVSRLLVRTDASGSYNASGQFGPYLSVWPPNTFNASPIVRFDGAAAGASQAGYRYVLASNTIEPDANVNTSRAVIDAMPPPMDPDSNSTILGRGYIISPSLPGTIIPVNAD